MIGHHYHHVSGFNKHALSAIGYRYAGESFSIERSESWVFHASLPSHSNRTWFTGLWRSRSHRVYVSDAIFHRVTVFNDASREGAGYVHHELEMTPEGVWGLDDDFVWAWGRSGGEPVLFLFDGTTWNRVPSPGAVTAIHGVRRDLCIAVGEGGLIARWDGTRWTAMESPVDVTLGGVFAAGDDDLWAFSPRGTLLAGSVYGWRKALEHGDGITAVARWRGELWLGAGIKLGLSKLVDGELVSVKPNLPATSLDAREDLIIGSRSMVAWSSDGAKYRGWPLSFLVDTAAPLRPAWE